MKKINKVYILASLILLLVILSPFINSVLHTHGISGTLFPTETVSPKPTAVGTRHWFSYKGEEGKNALELLKEKAAVETDPSGMVVDINNDRVDAKKKEFWAFYVNGKMATVGPEAYMTKSSDTIDWKIETY